MAEKIILKSFVVDENNNPVSEEILFSKEIVEPTDDTNFGYNQQEQLLIMAKTQQAMLNQQVDFLKSEVEKLSAMSQSSKKKW